MCGRKRIVGLALAVSVLLTGAFYAIIQGKNARATALTGGTGAAARPVLIVDPGHGGDDGGAVSVTGARESALNLAIGLRLALLADLCGLDVYMTRSAEQLAYPADVTSTAARKVWDTRDRVERINAVDRAVLISIHQNEYPDARPRGPQVFYGGEEGSRELAELSHEALTAHLWPQSRRLAAPVSPSVYIMAHTKHPAVLVECGFLSNPEEAALLETNSYELKVAAILLGSYLRYTEAVNEGEDDLLLY